MKRKILKHKNKRRSSQKKATKKSIQKNKNIIKNKNEQKDMKIKKEFKIIKKDFYDEEKIKNEFKDFYLMSEEIYYSDDEKEDDIINENHNNNDNDLEEKKKLKNNYKDINEENVDCCCEKDVDDCEEEEVDDDDDLRFQYNKKIMEVMEDDNSEYEQKQYKKYYEQVNNQNINYPVEEKTWSDDPTKLKFNIGDVVVLKNNKNGPTYKICYPSQKENFYVIKESGSLTEREIFGDLLEKAPAHNNKWVSYWELNPVIPAPKKFKKPSFLE